MSIQFSPTQPIVIRLPNWVGDIAMLTPTLRNLRLAYPNNRFIGVGKAFCKDILSPNQIFNEFIVLPGKSILKNAKALRTLKGSAGILFTNSLGSALEFFLAGLGPRIGYANDGRSLFLSHALKKPKVAMDLYYANLGSYCGAKPLCNQLEMLTETQSTKFAAQYLSGFHLDGQSDIIGLNPGAGFGETKRWFKEYFVELGKLALKHNPKSRFFVFAGPGEEGLGEFICQGIGKAAIPIWPANPGLNHIRAFVDKLTVMVTNDSGLRWYSLAKNIPTIVLFGSSDPNLTNCFTEHMRPLRVAVPCSPCKHRVCPTQHECMRELTPEHVFNILKQTLDESQKLIRL